MTVTGELVLTVYSIFIIMWAIIRDLKRGDKGWKGVLLIPTLILLMNI